MSSDINKDPIESDRVVKRKLGRLERPECVVEVMGAATRVEGWTSRGENCGGFLINGYGVIM